MRIVQLVQTTVKLHFFVCDVCKQQALISGLLQMIHTLVCTNHILLSFSKTPIEILHTILLGPVKYLLSNTIKSLPQQLKNQLHAKIQALDMSVFPATIRRNITRNYGSYVGRAINCGCKSLSSFCKISFHLNNSWSGNC
jgi:hypothetical protein